MGTDRARKNKIRAVMAATGTNYVRAAREIDGDNSYMRSSWGSSDWQRLLPAQAMSLEFVLSTATVLGQDGDLSTLVRKPAASSWFSHGVDTPLWWHDDKADEATAALRQHAQQSFEAAVAALGREMPTTVGELAELLAEVGVYQHRRTPNGGHRWRSPATLPAVTDVLPVPADWREREDQVRWISVTSGPALFMLDWLRHRGRPQSWDTTLQRLATDCDLRLDHVRTALDGLMYRFDVRVHRHDTVLGRHDLADLPEHARFRLLLDWDTIDEPDASDDDEDQDDSAEVLSTPETIMWQAAPWQVYRALAEDPRILPDDREFLGMMPFRLKNPAGISSTCLAEMALNYGASVDSVASSLIELAAAGLVRWLDDDQIAEIHDVRPLNR